LFVIVFNKVPVDLGELRLVQVGGQDIAAELDDLEVELSR